MIGLLSIALQSALVPPSSVPARLLGNPGSLILRDDYPALAMIDDVQGSTAFAIQVGSDGRAEGCKVTASSGSALLDDTTCNLVMRRARFSAATDKGIRVAGEWRNRVHWRLSGQYVVIDPRFDGPARVAARADTPFSQLPIAAALKSAGLAEAASATSFVMLDVDRSGYVSRCKYDGGDADRAHELLACPLFMGKSLFIPGFDRDGNAQSDRIRVKIRW